MTTPEWLVAWAGDEKSSVLEVTASGEAAVAVSTHLPRLVESGLAGGIARRDGTLWGAAAAPEASVRLAWVDLAETSRELINRPSQPNRGQSPQIACSANIRGREDSAKGLFQDHLSRCAAGASWTRPDP